jgi:NAD(P)H-dependent FMN reductase
MQRLDESHSLLRRATTPRLPWSPRPKPPAPARSHVALLDTSPRDGASAAALQQVVALLETEGVSTTRFAQRTMGVVGPGCADFGGSVAHAEMAASVAASRGVVIGGPVICGRVAGLTRNVVEVLNAELRTKPLLLVVAAGSARAHLAAVEFGADLWASFGTVPVPPVVISPDAGDCDARLRAGVAALLELAGIAPGAMRSPRRGNVR